MPVIQIQALPQENSVDIPATIKNVATAVSKLAGVPEYAVFCTWQELQPDFYTEGNTTATSQNQQTHPPIVNLTMFTGRSPELVETIIETIAEKIQHGLKMPEPNVFISYHEGQAGTIFTGRKIKR